ncbi:MAG: sensor histidine kinase [Caldilineales bacterium]|nr:sensor histidine kinase [Caldilineales bacterium]
MNTARNESHTVFTPSGQSRISTLLFQSSGYLVIVLVSLMALLDHFNPSGPGYEIRWLVLALLLAFFVMEVACQRLWASRLRMQRIILVLQAAIIVLLILISPTSGYFPTLFFVLTVKAAMLFEEREWLLWLLGFFLVTVATLSVEENFQMGILVGALYGGAYFFFGTFAKMTRDADTARKEMARLLAELSDANQQLQDYADQVQELTIVAERSRMAREMHDTVGHRLTVSAVQLEAAERICARDPEKAKEMMATVHEQVNAALSELRQTVAVLRAPLDEDLELGQSLQRLVSDFQAATSIDVHLSVPDQLPELPAPHRKALYRAAQESLTNIQRHANARKAWMSLSVEEGVIELSVGDDGVGVPAENTGTGFGLRGLRERAALLGGDFTLTSRPGGGSLATFRIPLQTEAAYV